MVHSIFVPLDQIPNARLCDNNTRLTRRNPIVTALHQGDGTEARYKSENSRQMEISALHG